MNSPRIICLMTASIDGGLHPSRCTQSPDGRVEDWTRAYETIHDRLDARGHHTGRERARHRRLVRPPRPPMGDAPHHHFQVLALDRQLDLPLGATRDQLLAAAAGHVIATGDLVGTYAEPK